MSINCQMDKQTVVYPDKEYYSVMDRKYNTTDTLLTNESQNQC